MIDPIMVARGGEFVPEWGNGGREDKIAIRYRFLTLGEEQRLLSEARREAGTDDIADIIGIQWIKKAIAMIESIDNLAVDDGEEMRIISTGDALFEEPGLVDLAYEVMHHLRDVTAVDKKKSQSELASGTKGKQSKQSAKR